MLQEQVEIAAGRYSWEPRHYGARFRYSKAWEMPVTEDASPSQAHRPDTPLLSD